MTLLKASVPGFPSAARKVASARTTFAQSIHLANACRFNSFSIPLQQTSRCKDMSYSASTRALCLTQFMPPVILTAISLYACPSYHRARRLAFGAYEADLHSGELTKDGKRIRLQAQPFQLLVMLLERPGQLVTREEICQKLWSADTFVDFDHSLGTAINKIRKVVNES